VTKRYGWKIVFHDTIRHQLETLHDAVSRTDHLTHEGRYLDPNVQLWCAVSQLMLKTIPENPMLPEYSRGVPASGPWQFWRLVKFGERFALFFRFHVEPNLIIYALITDTQSKVVKAGWTVE
jgi:toxin YhaV